MIASAFAQNGAKVYIASRKEKQLKEVGAQRHTSISGVFLTSASTKGLRKVERDQPWVLRVCRGRPERKPHTHRWREILLTHRMFLV